MRPAEGNLPPNNLFNFNPPEGAPTSPPVFSFSPKSNNGFTFGKREANPTPPPRFFSTAFADLKKQADENPPAQSSPPVVRFTMDEIKTEMKKVDREDGSQDLAKTESRVRVEEPLKRVQIQAPRAQKEMSVTDMVKQASEETSRATEEAVRSLSFGFKSEETRAKQKVDVVPDDLFGGTPPKGEPAMKPLPARPAAPVPQQPAPRWDGKNAAVLNPTPKSKTPPASSRVYHQTKQVQSGFLPPMIRGGVSMNTKKKDQ